jgi:hypothetical protein
LRWMLRDTDSESKIICLSIEHSRRKARFVRRRRRMPLPVIVNTMWKRDGESHGAATVYLPKPLADRRYEPDTS